MFCRFKRENKAAQTPQPILTVDPTIAALIKRMFACCPFRDDFTGFTYATVWRCGYGYCRTPIYNLKRAEVESLVSFFKTKGLACEIKMTPVGEKAYNYMIWFSQFPAGEGSTAIVSAINHILKVPAPRSAIKSDCSVM